jgi:hypothetical protein
MIRKNALGILLIAMTMFTLSPAEAKAANFTLARLRYDRMKAAAPSSLQITIVPATVGTEDKVKIVFGGGTIGTGQTVSVTNIPAGSSA